MTRFDFWNNPLVVSAFRLKGKKQFPLAAYVVVLVAIGAVFEYLARTADRPWQTPWHHIHMVVVVSLTAGASFLFAMVATQTSISSEVANKTLDFQRIAGLSPAEVVVGKIFGEPALAYLLIPASFPVALFGVLRSDELTLGSLLLVYLDLLAFAIMGGAFGLLHPLEQTTGKPGGGGSAGGWAVVFMIAAPYLISSGFLVAKSPTAAFILGTFTPVSIIAGLHAGDVWKYPLHLYDWTIPYVVYSPIAQLSTAFLLFSMMTRRLKNPVETPLSKPLAYAAMAVADLLIVGFIVGENPLGSLGGVGHQLATFAIAHTIVGAGIVFCVTPNRDGVDSWIWGLRKVRRDFVDWLVGDRSPNFAAVVVLSFIGSVAACLLLALTTGVGSGLSERSALGQSTAPFANGVGWAVAVVLFLAFGFTLQAAALIMKRMAAFLLTGTLFFFVGLLGAGAGRKLEWGFLASLSPFTMFMSWMDPREFEGIDVSPIPFFFLFGGLVGGTAAIVLRYLWGMRRIVEAKLKSMGVGVETPNP